MKTNNILYLNDNILYFYHLKTDKILIKKLKSNILKYGKIANINLFSKEFTSFLNENNLFNHLFNENIIVVINPTYTNAEKYILTSVLEKINYKKIIFINEVIYLNLKENNYLNYNNDYGIYYYKDNFNKNKCILFTDLDIIDYSKLCKNNKSLILYGNNKTIENFQKEFENKYKINTFINKEFSKFLIKNLSKMNN